MDDPNHNLDNIREEGQNDYVIEGTLSFINNHYRGGVDRR